MGDFKEYSLFSRKHTSESPEADYLQAIKQLQSSVYNAFSARRNAARIDHYFINLRSSRFKLMLFAICTVLVVLTVILTLIFENNMYIDVINGLAMDMMDSIHNRIFNSIRSALAEPQFFTKVFSDFLQKPQLITPSMESAPSVTSMLAKAHLASSGNIIWWDIGMPSGDFFSIESYQKDSLHIYLLYGNSSESGDKRVRYWVSNSTGGNASYPYSGGDDLGPFIVTQRNWYKLAESRQTSTWTNMYKSNGAIGSMIMISSITPTIENGTLKAVTANGIGLHMAQKIISAQQPSNLSRLALTTSRGEIIAVTGDDQIPTDEFNNMLVTKQLDSLNDELWQCITADPDYRSKESTTKECRTSKAKQSSNTFQITQQSIEPAPGIKWILWSALCIDDFVGDMDGVFRKNVIVSLVIVAGIWLFLVLGSIIIRMYISIMQNRILEQDRPKKSLHHVKPAGILLAIHELKKLQRAHANNQLIVQEISEVLSDLQRNDPNFYYDSENVYETIEDKTVRDILKKIYGSNTTKYISRLPTTNVHTPSFEAAKIITRNRVRSVLSVSPIDITGSPQNVTNPKRSLSILMTNDVMYRKIIIAFRQCNEKCQMFSDEMLVDILHATFSEINEQTMPILTDSIDFLRYLVQLNIDTIIEDSNMEMAILIALLAWHITMQKRFDPTIERIHRFFLTDSTEFNALAKALLLRFFGARTVETDFDNVRWENLSSSVIALVETSPISLHHSVISRFALISRNLPDMDVISMQEATVCFQFFFNLAQVSYFFHKQSEVIVFFQLINPDFNQNEPAILEYAHCIFTELVEPAVDLVKRTTDTKFLDILND